jgi:hypothetical protein
VVASAREVVALAAAGWEASMAEEESSFKVTDRRGRARETMPIEIEVPRSQGTPPRESHSARDISRAGDPVAGAPDLAALFVMFASSALIHLGEAPDPATGQRHHDLQQAKEAIDLLLLLREKTEGNRTPDESRLLEDILYDVQMRFVQAAGGRRGA